jgi:hypothetical protein
MQIHVLNGQDYLVVVTAAILMVTNLLGAGLTIRRILSRSKPQNGETSPGLWSSLLESPIRLLGVTAVPVILALFASILVAENSNAFAGSFLLRLRDLVDFIWR